MNISEFDVYFAHLSTFISKHGIAKQDGVNGLNIDEISSLEFELGKSFGAGFKSFLHYFGDKIYLRGSSTMFVNFGSSVRRAYIHAEDIYRDIANIDIDNSDIKGSKILYLNEVIVVHFDDMGQCFYLINEKEDNPIIYYHYGGNAIYSSRSRLTDYIRWAIFDRIMSVLKQENSSKIDESSLLPSLDNKWLRFYRSKVEDDRFWADYFENRASYQELLYEMDDESKILSSFNEWENSFVDFLS